MKLETNKSLLKEEKAEFEEYVRVKDKKVKNLLEFNCQLETQVKDLEKKEVLCKNITLPYPCDKCESAFQTAGLLVKHVQKKHENMPVPRP